MRYSRYRDTSLVSEINRMAAVGGSIEVDAETAGLLDYADACHRASDGLFDVSSGILRRAWRFDRAELPDAGRVAELLDKVGWDRIRWERPRLAFPVAGMEIDLGGVVKEYAADRAAALCRAAGVGRGMVNLGGDIRIVGPRPDGGPWGIGIQHPRRQGELLAHAPALRGRGRLQRRLRALRRDRRRPLRSHPESEDRLAGAPPRRGQCGGGPRRGGRQRLHHRDAAGGRRPGLAGTLRASPPVGRRARARGRPAGGVT